MKYLWNQLEYLKPILKKRQILNLFLDFDGTLSPLVPTPSLGKLPKSTKLVLERLASLNNLHLAIISGRALDDIKSKTNIPGILYSGNHGMEWEHNGELHQAKIPFETLKILQIIKNEMVKISQNFLGSVVEDKIFSVAFHYRGINPNKKRFIEKTLHKEFSKYLQAHKIDLLFNKDTYDIRAKNGWTKGELVQHLRGLFSKGRDKVIYIGDSATDEDAFTKLTDDITIKVGFSKNSSAKYFLKDEKDVQRFLNWLYYNLTDHSEK